MTDSYQVLQKKLNKVESLLFKLELKGDKDSKDYRAFERKRKEYQFKIQRTTEYKEQKLQNALEELHNSLHSIGTVDLISEDGGSAMSMNFEEEEEEETPIPVAVLKFDYELTVRKYDKVRRLVEDIIEDHGEEEAKQRKDYQKYQKKAKEYLGLLETTSEWKEEVSRRAEQEARAKAQAKAEAEQEELIRKQKEAADKAREAQQAELEKQKAAALAKLRKDRAAREEHEKIRQLAYEEAERAARKVLLKESEQLEEETRKREKEYADLVKQQEDRGMIRVVHK
eukprot:Nitzschia sp. Nitz4//scaffold50_size126154//14288//15139//NITZ4_003669-RA/size126154-processed-gene-0.28-mRNA-1//1//CDS//3329553650//6915//frame0